MNKLNDGVNYLYVIELSTLKGQGKRNQKNIKETHNAQVHFYVDDNPLAVGATTNAFA